MLEGAKTLDDMKGALPLDGTRAAWASVSQALQDALGTLTAGQLDTPSNMRFPIADKSLLGVLAFLVQHDSYHLDQFSLLRRQLGHPGMSDKWKRHAGPGAFLAGSFASGAALRTPVSRLKFMSLVLWLLGLAFIGHVDGPHPQDGRAGEGRDRSAWGGTSIRGTRGPAPPTMPPGWRP
jgi:hypothetical protein